MCGIIYAKSFENKNVNRRIRKMYFRQKSRGTDGYGFLAINSKSFKLVRTIYEHDIMSKLKQIQAKEIIFHHRIPTSTKNSSNTNHPIVAISKNYSHNYYLVHNGIISNDESIKKEHYELGIKYSTVEKNGRFNDSECLLHDLALYLEGIKDENEFKVAGSVAFILLQTNKLNQPVALYFGRNHYNPLKIDYDKDEFIILSSEGNGKDIDPNILFRFDYKSKEITTKQFEFPSYSYTCSYSRSGDYYDNDYLERYDKETEKHLITSGEKSSIQTISLPFHTLDCQYEL